MRERCKGGDPACLSLSHSHKLHKTPSHSHVPQSATVPEVSPPEVRPRARCRPRPRLHGRMDDAEEERSFFKRIVKLQSAVCIFRSDGQLSAALPRGASPPPWPRLFRNTVSGSVCSSVPEDEMAGSVRPVPGEK